MKKFKIFTLCALGLATAALTACSDQSEEITSILLNRNLSPIGLEATGVGETTASFRWTQSLNATSYNLKIYADDSLSYNMDGNAVKEVNGITPDQIPVTVDGLFFDTQYTVYVQAITDGNDSRTSTWNGAYFKTSTKQFLKNPKPAEISDRSVTLSWEVEEGFDVSTIVIGSITHEITAEEKAAGQATIDGLTPETTYTAYLYYNGKQCGNRNFTTIADLAGATLVHPEDDLKKLIEDENLQDGTVFALYGGTYRLNATYDEETGELLSTGAAKVYKNITIKGIYPTDQPIIKGRFELYDGAGLSLSQVIINGLDNGTTDQIFNYKLDQAAAGTTFGALDIQNCEIFGRSDGKGLIYLNVQAAVESINVKNSIVHGIECSGGDFIDSRTGYPKQINLIESTFYTVASTRDFIRVDDASGNFAGVAGPQVKVDHCTLYNVGAGSSSGAANYRLLYVRFAGNKLTFTNNIVVGTTYKRGFTNQSSSDQEPTLQNNYYFNCQNLTSAGTGADATIQWFDENGTIGDPGFADPDKGDFTLNVDGAAYKGEAGDPRWRTAQ
ncbi:MAG: DUF4957 domain-containing protein [Prevotella sp.]|nr:DUF4957 domain-containing protein [Prevotella sp.]